MDLTEFSVSAAARDGETVVTVRGEIDIATAPALEAALDDAISLHPYIVIVDLSAVTFMDSSACHCLITANREAAKSVVALELSGVDGPKHRALEILGLDKVLTIRPS
jgi:anti-sigma B factor antagonist